MKNLLLYGFDSIEFTTKLKIKLNIWNVSQQDQLVLEGKLSQKLSAEGLGFIRNFFWKRNLDSKGLEEELGLREIIYFQGRDMCFAMRQLLGYYNDGYSWAWDSENKRFPNYEGNFVLSRIEVSQVLDWFITISTRLAKAVTPSEPLSVHAEMQVEAEKLIRTGYCKSEEFEYFSDYYPMFSQWKNEVEQSGLKEFYWLNF